MRKLAFVIVLMFGGVALAQTAPATTTPEGPMPPVRKAPRWKKRTEMQQQRIGQGMESGQLTAGEAARLERKEAAINREERRMAHDGDGLNPAEKARLERQQDRMSKQIYRQKHDAQHQPPAKGLIETRDRNQQLRIGQGVKSGQLTAGETARLESREAGLQRREARMRASGGGLTQGERKAINKQQNNLSRKIYRQKHDAQHR